MDNPILSQPKQLDYINSSKSSILNKFKQSSSSSNAKNYKNNYQTVPKSSTFNLSSVDENINIDNNEKKQDDEPLNIDDTISIKSSSSNPIGKLRKTKSSIFNHLTRHLTSSNINTYNELELDDQQQKFYELSRRNNSNLSTSNIKERYKRDLEKWTMTLKLNKNYKYDDPLTYASTRLNCFFDVYDTLLMDGKQIPPSSSNNRKNSIITTNLLSTSSSTEESDIFNEKLDLIGFWSVSALKFLSGVNKLVSNGILTEFSNYDLKSSEKIRIFVTGCEFLGIQWPWQLAIDNPNSITYDFSIEPILHTAYSNYKQLIGPSNYHSIHGESHLNLSFSQNSFSFALCYSYWLFLKNDEWIPTLSELYRILSPQGQLNLLMIDFDVINCSNSKYNEFFIKLREILIKNNMDPYPCKHIQQRLKDSGFKTIKYSFLSLKRGLSTKMGNLMDLIQSYFEYIIFEKLTTNLKMEQDELEYFKDAIIKFHNDVRSGESLNEYGNYYYMFVFAQKI
ncbi:hypothetical protein WICMUC_000164 [Wickerhamomyces mucosus]|uniref:Methyltransferase type 11 domain-containing protein n=1 Tax=Wickerhamomyces mucosus TaxID=1378264 RepID=A0A9P8PYS2_9ASCO|nr:hypothetical protein WICMUC_000164 [Wickerhamomyces mucosus]